MPPIETILAENQALKGKVETLNEKVASLEVQLEWLKKQMFGPGKNERQDRAQLMLKLGNLEAQIKAAATQTITYERRTKGTPRQTPQEGFEHLPVKETIELVPDEVKADPDLYERIGEETTFEVDITQPQLYKRVIVRPKYRHRLDRSRPPVVASALQRLMMGGYASAGLVSWVVISKYCHHLPLARLEKMSERWGAKLSRQSMSDWVAAAAERLEPIYLRMKRRSWPENTSKRTKRRSVAKIRTIPAGKPLKLGSGRSITRIATSCSCGGCPAVTAKLTRFWRASRACSKSTASLATPTS